MIRPATEARARVKSELVYAAERARARQAIAEWAATWEHAKDGLTYVEDAGGARYVVTMAEAKARLEEAIQLYSGLMHDAVQRRRTQTAERARMERRYNPEAKGIRR